jgi:hypothetical protein
LTCLLISPSHTQYPSYNTHWLLSMLDSIMPLLSLWNFFPSLVLFHTLFLVKTYSTTSLRNSLTLSIKAYYTFTLWPKNFILINIPKKYTYTHAAKHM